MPRAGRVKIIEKLADLTPDPENFNMGTPRGLGRIEVSVDRYGFARSIVADAQGIVRAGNHVLQVAAEKNPKIKVVQVSGDELVVVQRIDWDESKEIQERSYGLADNRTNQLNYNPNPVLMLDAMEQGVELSEFFYKEEIEALANAPEPGSWNGGGSGGEHAPTCPECGQTIKRKKK